MKLNIQKLSVILVTFSLAVGLLSQTSASQASAELSLPDCVGIITNCNNQECTANASNEISDDYSISQANQVDATQGSQSEFTQTSQDNSGAGSGINTLSLADAIQQVISITQSNSATIADEDQNTQTSTASTTCDYNNEDW